MPLVAGTRVFGSITFTSTNFRVLWTDDLVKQLKMLAELFSSTLTRKRATQALRASVAELTRSEAELREMSGRLINAEERERLRISQELHDDLGQQMALLSVGLDQIQSTAAGSSSESREQLQKLSERLSEVSTTIHNLARQLHPTTLDILGLVPSLQHLCREFSLKHVLQVQFVCRDTPGRCSERSCAVSLSNRPGGAQQRSQAQRSR